MEANELDVVFGSSLLSNGGKRVSKRRRASKKSKKRSSKKRVCRLSRKGRCTLHKSGKSNPECRKSRKTGRCNFRRSAKSRSMRKVRSNRKMSGRKGRRSTRRQSTSQRVEIPRVMKPVSLPLMRNVEIPQRQAASLPIMRNVEPQQRVFSQPITESVRQRPLSLP
jgi:hypothetical protein